MSSFGPPPKKKGTSSNSRGTNQAGDGKRTGSSGGAVGSGAARPSQRLNPKTVDPFTNQKKSKSAFETVYVSGGVPCRLVHGSVKHKLQWESNPEDIPYDPVLLTLAEGLKEFKHPYQFVAQQGFKELLQIEGAHVKAVPLLTRLIPPLRAALGSGNESVYLGAVIALVDLSGAVGPHLNSHLKSVLAYLSKHQNDKKFRDQIYSALQEIEQNCGRESVPIIKSKIPTYTSIT
ncbi:PACRG-like protein [Strongylocentrotus purpuratus]|uniref:PACRG-like protein n=1 Tax=Strongylocentrotus purpuratus TaxID=7668 RepID=A0A7M7SZ57_STRPU|nr:PACRG-like protein [Strongylocentrotus purpuratus]